MWKGMRKMNTDKKNNAYIWLMAFTYMISYVTRINYGAVILAMQEGTGLSASALSMALTGSFITYGAGQVISGFVGDRVSPKKLIFMGLLLTTCMNVLVPLCPTAGAKLFIWCINGFAQSFMWPPMVRLMTGLFDVETYQKAVVRVSWGSSFGTILVYLAAPLLITVSGWESVFFSSAALSGGLALVFLRLCPDIEVRYTKKETKRGSGGLFSPMMLAIMLAIVLMGTLRDGITTWMPSYIDETYHLGSAASILTGAVLPAFSILCFQLAHRIHNKWLKNPIFCAAVIFAAGMISAFLLFLFSGKSAAFSVGFSALLIGSMHGVNLMLISIVPSYFREGGNVSTVSGALNACTYIGSAMSAYGMARLSETAGWSATLLLWTAIAFFGTCLCFLAVKPWQKRYHVR